MVASLAAPVAAQSRQITGIVKEAYTDRVVTNAEVIVVGEQTGVCTNEKGEYRLKVPTGNVNIIARTTELLSRPTAVGAGQAKATLAIEPQLRWPVEQLRAGEIVAVGGYVFARLLD